MSLKEKMMNSMMDKQFSNMSSEEKKEMMNSMMDKFFSNMTKEEKQSMMSEMMPKMMGNMMGEGSGGMKNMMSMMMGKQHKHSEEKPQGKVNMHMSNPMEICMKMMQNMGASSHKADFVTPELHLLFDEWCQQIENEMHDYINESGKIDLSALSEKFKLTEESVKYLLTKMSEKGRIDFQSS